MRGTVSVASPSVFGGSKTNQFFQESFTSSMHTNESVASAISALSCDNERLKKKRSELENMKRNSGAVQIQSMKRDLIEKEKTYKQYRTLTEKELQKLNRMHASTTQEISRMRSDLASEDPSAISDRPSLVDDMRSQLSEMSVEFENEKRDNKKIVAKNAKDIEDMLAQLEGKRGEDKKMRLRVRQLENELELALRKVEILNKGGRRAGGGSSSKKRDLASPTVRVQRTSFEKRTPPARFGTKAGGGATGNKFRTPPSKAHLGYSAGSGRSSNGSSQRKPLYPGGSGSRGRVSGSGYGPTSRSPGNRLYSPSGRPRSGDRRAE